jgi:hypothetical protein
VNTDGIYMNNFFVIPAVVPEAHSIHIHFATEGTEITSPMHHTPCPLPFTPWTFSQCPLRAPRLALRSGRQVWQICIQDLMQILLNHEGIRMVREEKDGGQTSPECMVHGAWCMGTLKITMTNFQIPRKSQAPNLNDQTNV